MKKIYGNKPLLSTLNNMRATNKLAQAVIFYGEKGSGKKLIAEYYTALILCESPSGGKPCGNCRSCHNFLNGWHPDVTYVQKEGKLESYTVKTARYVSYDVNVKPNNMTDKKVYIFSDCLNVNTHTQNSLLKLIEEPPSYAYFIFTAESKSEFLPTVISRCLCFATSICTEQEAEEALTLEGFKPADIKEAINCFHGNIGKCTEYLTDEKVREQVDLTKRVANSIINRDEYYLNKAFYSLSGMRSSIREMLSAVDALIRDAIVLAKNENAGTIGCCREASEAISGMITTYQAVNIHKALERAWKSIEANANAPLVLAGVCSEIMEIID